MTPLDHVLIVGGIVGVMNNATHLDPLGPYLDRLQARWDAWRLTDAP